MKADKEKLGVAPAAVGGDGPAVRKDDTEAGRRIWDAVDRAAERAPAWIKEKLLKGA